jgi:hypothetical protein
MPGRPGEHNASCDVGTRLVLAHKSDDFRVRSLRNRLNMPLPAAREVWR